MAMGSTSVLSRSGHPYYSQIGTTPPCCLQTCHVGPAQWAAGCATEGLVVWGRVSTNEESRLISFPVNHYVFPSVITSYLFLKS